MLGRARILAKVLAAVLFLAVLTALVAFAEFERRETLSHAQVRAGLVARTLEGNVTRTVESASLILQTLGEAVAQQASSEPQRLQPLLAQNLLNRQPFLRSAAVLDESGRVLASSIAAEQGLRVDLDKLAPLPPEGRETLSTLRPGRSLSDLAQDAIIPHLAGVGMLPLLRSLPGPGGRRFLLVALINPDALANFQQVAMSDEGSEALLSSWDGRLVVGTTGLTVTPGAKLSEHPVFQSWLPKREHGEYIGTGAMTGRQVVAFRASRSRPLVLIVELAERVVLKTWFERLRWLGLAALVALAAIAGGLAALLREMNAREKARTALDGAHEQVALRERELSVLLKSVQELIFRTDARGAITYVNARWSSISDEALERAKGSLLEDLAAPADRRRVAELFNLDDRSGVRQAQVSIPAADGKSRHFQVAVVPLHGDGHIVGFAGSAIDVTDRVTAGQQLQHQLAFTGLLLEISPLPVSMFDANGHYVLVNQAWEEFVGRRRSDVIGTRVGHFLSPQEAGQHADQDARLLAAGGRLQYETQVQHRDGSHRDMVVTKVLVPGEDSSAPAGILCTLMDVSEFRDAERATREARDAAEAASNAKSEFIANISHELRTPLQAILGFSELGAVRGSAHPKFAGMFTNIHNSGQRMLALVNDLLDVSKIESSVGAFRLKRCDMREVVRAVLQEVDPLLGQRGLNLTLRLPDEPLTAKVDPSRMHQAIRNVVANAIKFSPHGGSLRVDCVSSVDNEMTISIADQGPGIPPAELEAIFDAFVQSSQTKDGSGGTGLGLAISRKIVEIHGGRITAANRAGGGAIFRIQLPLRTVGESQLHTTY